ncbi:MAG: copper amine oxidase N-terminal domain-containing protein [Bacillota bacterium]
MKRKLSLLLALVMILSLVPMSAFAATDNAVNKVPNVADDATFRNANTAPQLRVEEDNADEFGGTNQKFRLKLTNAEWLKDVTSAADQFTTAPSGTTLDFETAFQSLNPGSFASVNRMTDTTVEVVVYDVNVGTADTYKFPMLVELQGAGEAKVTIDSMGSSVSSGTYTFAVGSSGATVATVSDSETLEDSNNEKAADIIIDETNIGAIGNGTAKFRLKLNGDFEWNETSMETLANNYVTATGNLTIDSVVADGNKLDITYTATADSAIRSITIKPYIDTTDADFGEVYVSIDGLNSDISDANNLLVGEYSDYGIDVSVEDVKEFYAGRMNDDDDILTEKITIEETIENSLLEGRTIEFSLPDWVKLVDHDDDGDIDADDLNITTESGLAPVSVDIDSDGSGFEFKVPAVSGDTIEWTLELPITAKANQAGDVVLTIDGAGIDEEELTIAKVVAPITAEIKVADVKIGVQNQDAPEILIKEVAPGALREDANLELWFEKDGYVIFEDAEFEVVDGDLEINDDDSDVDDDKLTIVIDSASSEASTIKVSGIKLTLDRTVPEGLFNIRVGGSAVVENYVTIDQDDWQTGGSFDATKVPVYVPYNEDDGYFTDDFTSRVIQTAFANVVTKATGTEATTSKFVIGSTTYKVVVGNEEVEKTMDVAPFIEGGRTFLPIRFVAEALGVSSDNIIWNDAARTVTIIKGDRVAAMTIDSNIMTVNGTQIPMDAAAMIKDGRTVLPVRFAAQALGAQIAWDEATQTVTVNQ